MFIAAAGQLGIVTGAFQAQMPLVEQR
jgi:hypothetical protein